MEHRHWETVQIVDSLRNIESDAAADLPRELELEVVEEVPE